jgi:hypothetical protein
MTKKLIYAISAAIVFFTGLNFAVCNFRVPGSIITSGFISPPADCSKTQNQSIQHLLQLLALIIALKAKIDDDDKK